ncbi:MAG: NnrU family protein [Pseudomonadota bacterium]
MGSLIAAAIAFAGTHFLLSHPLREPLVRAIGARGFLGLYVATAFATFGWLIFAFRATPPEPLWWAADDKVWLAASAVMLLASILFLASLFGNPAFPDPTGGTPKFGEARGVYAVTRHPMMWGFALWAAVHVAVFPTGANAVLSAAILVLALAGAALQDRKKASLVPGWTDWQARTSYLPFAAQLAGKARWTLGDMRAILGGTALWIVATKLHVVLGGAMEAGIWRWVTIE